MKQRDAEYSSAAGSEARSPKREENEALEEMVGCQWTRRIGVPQSIHTCTIRELRSEARRELDDIGITTSVTGEAYQPNGKFALRPGHAHCRT